MNVQPWLLICIRYVRRDTSYLQNKTKISRIRYTRYQRPGTTNHPHHLQSDMMFSLSLLQHLKKTLINIVYPHPSFGLFFAFRVMADFCLQLVQLLMCNVDYFFHLGLLIFFCTCNLLRGIVFFTCSHPPTYTHPPTLQGFCADAHRFTLKCWWVVGVGWTTFKDSPYESDYFGDPGKSNNVTFLFCS